MIDTSSTLAGTLEPWPKKEVLGELLQSHGLEVYIGPYSVQIRGNGPTHFSFEHYGGDICDPVIEADSDTLEGMEKLAKVVSTILKTANIKHSFEIYDHEVQLAYYLHHGHPR